MKPNPTIECCSGAVVFTKINDVIHYVIVVESDGHGGLPKGHMEAGESATETALREIREETGISLTSFMDDFCEEIIYPLPHGNIKRTTYFCGYYENQRIQPDLNELQEVKLLPYEEALSRLKYEQVKTVLTKANDYINTTSTHRMNL